MLILSRNLGQKINIGDDITLTVLEVKGNAVRLGISAPKDVSVHREEIYKRIQDQNSDEGDSHQNNPKIIHLRRQFRKPEL